MTTKKLSWLHLSDLHIGSHNKTLWPNFRSSFKKDLLRLADKAGPIDLVLFSGDMTQSGEKDEYVTLTNELCEIWEELDKLNQCPVLFSVPGNHDLVRPLKNDARMKVLTCWDSDPEVVSEFWEVENNQYINLVEEAFSNYTNWQNEIEKQGIKFAPQQKGILPGDASSSLEINGISVGLIGLNTSFLQLNSDDFNERLALDHRQLNAITGDDAPAWCNKHDINFLITHQDDSQRIFLDTCTSQCYQRNTMVVILVESLFRAHHYLEWNILMMVRQSVYMVIQLVKFYLKEMRCIGSYGQEKEL